MPQLGGGSGGGGGARRKRSESTAGVQQEAGGAWLVSFCSVLFVKLENLYIRLWWECQRLRTFLLFLKSSLVVP